MVRILMAAGFQPKTLDLIDKSSDRYSLEYAKLKEICQSPISLKDSCRLTIRKNLPKPIQMHVNFLPLPHLLKHFLSFKIML